MVLLKSILNASIVLKTRLCTASVTRFPSAVPLAHVRWITAAKKDKAMNVDVTKSSECTVPLANDSEVKDDEEIEQEDMFVDPHESFEYSTKEWGGPRRGGRLPEPTRYGDWERKGRCSDF